PPAPNVPRRATMRSDPRGTLGAVCNRKGGKRVGKEPGSWVRIPIMTERRVRIGILTHNQSGASPALLAAHGTSGRAPKTRRVSDDDTPLSGIGGCSFHGPGSSGKIPPADERNRQRNR